MSFQRSKQIFLIQILILNFWLAVCLVLKSPYLCLYSNYVSLEKRSNSVFGLFLKAVQVQK